MKKIFVISGDVRFEHVAEVAFVHESGALEVSGTVALDTGLMEFPEAAYAPGHRDKLGFVEQAP